MEPLRICFVCSELTPLAKTGGLADVSASLPRYLHREGHDVRVFLPLYSTIDTAALELYPVDYLREIPLRFGSRVYVFSGYTTRLPGTETGMYLIHCPELYERRSIYTSDGDEHLRFALLTRAAIDTCQRMGWSPDLFHCNDWHTALLPLYLRTIYGWDALFGGSRTVLTIHNIGYQGIFGVEALDDLGFGSYAQLFDHADLGAGRINYLRTGVLYADVLTTVSPTYAQEIQDERYGMGLDVALRARSHSLFGILNGVDYDEWNPETDERIACRYSTRNLPAKGRNKKALLRGMGLPHRPGVPVLGAVSRLTPQKGFDLCFDVLPEFLAANDLRFCILGSGDEKYESFFSELQRRFPEKVCYYRGYNDKLAHLIEAGADMFLMPSLYEPCGLNQMFSLKYGTVPIVRKTGGLADSVQLFNPVSGEGTGIVFDHFTAEGLRWALGFALELWQDRMAWRRMMLNGMAQDFSWERQGAQYLRLYRGLLGR